MGDNINYNLNVNIYFLHVLFGILKAFKTWHISQGVGGGGFLFDE